MNLNRIKKKSWKWTQDRRKVCPSLNTMLSTYCRLPNVPKCPFSHYPSQRNHFHAPYNWLENSLAWGWDSQRHPLTPFHWYSWQSDPGSYHFVILYIFPNTTMTHLVQHISNFLCHKCYSVLWTYREQRNLWCFCLNASSSKRISFWNCNTQNLVPLIVPWN